LREEKAKATYPKAPEVQESYDREVITDQGREGIYGREMLL